MMQTARAVRLIADFWAEARGRREPMLNMPKQAFTILFFKRGGGGSKALHPKLQHLEKS